MIRMTGYRITSWLMYIKQMGKSDLVKSHQQAVFHYKDDNLGGNLTDLINLKLEKEMAGLWLSLRAKAQDNVAQ